MEFNQLPPSIAESISSEQSNRNGRSRLAYALGSVVNSGVGLVDVDEIIRRIDVNDVVSRVNWNDVADEIDWNNLMEHLDVDAIMQRVDVNAVVERIDVNAVIERSNLKSIIARGTSGICFMALDSFRAIAIKSDQLLQRMGNCSDCLCCCPDYSKWTLPPLPTVTPFKRQKMRREDRKLRKTMACPRKSTHLAIAVQGRCAGTCSRFIGFAIDKGLTIGFVFLLVLIIAQLINLVPESEMEAAKNATGVFGIRDGEISSQGKLFVAVLLPVILNFCLGFIFDALFLAVIGRTVGKIVMGLVVVDSRHGRVKHISVNQAILRSLLTNLGVFTVVGTLVSLVRDDRRGIIDLICGTTVIYAWDAKRYRLAEEDLAKDMPFGDLESQTDEGASMRRRSSILGRKKRNAIHGNRNKRRVETKVVTVPIFDEDYTT